MVVEGEISKNVAEIVALGTIEHTLDYIVPPDHSGLMVGIALFYVTFPSRESAETVSGELLDRGLLACANILPAHTSLYRWKGKRERSSEVVAFLKTTKPRKDEVFEACRRLHPYDVPCILEIDVHRCEEAYAAWALSEVSE